MKALSILSVSAWLLSLAGCNSSLDYLSNSQKEAVKCANNWKAEGFNFDPNTMTCIEMFRRGSAIQRAEHWRKKGYVFDPNSLTWLEMDQQVKHVDRARYWQERGYDFDPNVMTALEMDRQAEEFKNMQRWKKRGYYYDPNSQTVFLSEHKRTKLQSLANLHNRATIVQSIPAPRQSIPAPRSYQVPSARMRLSGRGNTYLFTGDGHWVKKKIDSGNFIQLEDNSLWQVSSSDRLNSSLWLHLDEITVVESRNPNYPYLLINTDDGEKVEGKLISD